MTLMCDLYDLRVRICQAHAPDAFENLLWKWRVEFLQFEYQEDVLVVRIKYNIFANVSSH